MLLLRTAQVVNLGSVENDISLYTKASSPKDARISIFKNTAAKTGNAAVTIGTSWKGGSDVVLINTSTITGNTGTNGSNGAGGTGGTGISGAGTGRTAGSAGSNGTNGANGGIALLVNSTSTVKVRVNNSGGTITGGTAGTRGQGGGGGGGAG
jgi:hypothetical protein